MTQFWKDPWLHNVPLIEAYPLLFDICQSPDMTFNKCVDRNFDIPFRRRLYEVINNQWNYIVEKAREMRVSDHDDVVF